MSTLVQLNQITFRITGTTTLIMHDKKTADPLNAYTKALAAETGKRKKTDDDHWKIARLEFEAGLYLAKDAGGNYLGPVIPGDNIRGFFVGTGGTSKNYREGPIATRGLFYHGPYLLEYDGPRDVEGLWEAGFHRRDSLPLGRTGRVIRTRPEFPVGWQATITLTYDPSIIKDPLQIQKWVEYGGQCVGLMDWRPTHGRFTAERID